MDRRFRRLFLQVCSILLFCVEFSLSEDFDVTTIYKFEEASFNKYKADNNISVEIHARNNARGLQFYSKTRELIDPNVGIDIETCNFNSCNWILSNFTKDFQRKQLNGDSMQNGEKSAFGRFYESLSFTFNTNRSSDDIYVYLMESPDALKEKGRFYYFKISNRNRYNNNYLYRCSGSYSGSYANIEPNYGTQNCNSVKSLYYPHSYWESHEYEFIVEMKGRLINLKVTAKGSTYELFEYNDNYQYRLNIQYYMVQTNIGTITVQNSVSPYTVLTEEHGTIVSKAYSPKSTEVCVSVLYHKGPLGHITLQAVEDNEKKWPLIHLQTTSLGFGWLSSIFTAKLPEPKTYKYLRIELSAVAPLDKSYNIAIQRIAGCNSEGLEEDIYAMPSTVNNSDFLAYDVAVSRVISDSELSCMNGGLYDSGRNSCICPAGFTGEICEIGCGPDRYDSKCSGRCSKTEKGCIGMKLCRPKLGCKCAPGLKGPVCNSACSVGTYGADCSEKCGACVKGCDIYTGHCSSGCQEGFYPPYCQTHYKHLTVPPKIVVIDYNTLQVTSSIGPNSLAGNGTPTFYQLQFKDGDNRVATWMELEPVRLPTIETIESNITQLTAGTNYNVRVILLDIDGNSYQGEDIPVSNGFTPCIIPTANYSLHTGFIEQNEFQVKWEYTVQSSLWCKVTHFEVEMRTGWKWIKYYEGPNKIVTFSGLLPGEKYEVRVRGVGVKGPIGYSETLTVFTKDEAPQTISLPIIASRTHNEIQVDWKEPFVSGGKIQKYKVTYQCQKLLSCKDKSCSYISGEVEVTTPSVTLQRLIPHAQYLIGISAKSALYGPEVQILATTDMTEPAVPPGQSNSPVTHRTNSTLTLEWKKPENCTYLNGYLYTYQYEIFEPRNPLPIQKGTTPNTSATFGDLKPHTDYEIKIYLKTSGGISASHPIVIKATTRATVPGKVEQLTVYKIGRHLIGLRWAGPKHMYGEIQSFTISYRSEHHKVHSFMIKPVTCVAWPELYCHTINSVRSDTQYTITVQARNKEIDEDGEVAQVIAITKESSPLAPEYIRTVSQTDTSITIQWAIPKLLNGVLRSYVVNLEETDSANVSSCCQYFPIQEVPVKHEQASYQLQLSNLKAASTYAISVSAKTVALGPPVGITTHTRPPVPDMEGMLELTDNGFSSEMSISGTPSLNINTSAINHDLLVGYLVVMIPQSASVLNEETRISNEWLAKEMKEKINGTFYIAAELKKDDLDNDPAELNLGKQSGLQDGKWSTLWDPVLETGEQYQIGLVAILNYCDILNVGYTATDILTVA